MPDSFSHEIANSGPHTAESLTEKLPGFPLEAVRDALEALTAQGVLKRDAGPDGRPQYTYVAPERYAQANLDVIQDPGAAHNRRRG